MMPYGKNDERNILEGFFTSKCANFCDFASIPKRLKPPFELGWVESICKKNRQKSFLVIKNESTKHGKGVPKPGGGSSVTPFLAPPYHV